MPKKDLCAAAGAVAEPILPGLTIALKATTLKSAARVIAANLCITASRQYLKKCGRGLLQYGSYHLLKGLYLSGIRPIPLSSGARRKAMDVD